MRANVLSRIVLRVEHTNVELINDQIVERGRTKSRVVPNVFVRIADDAIARIPGITAAHFQFARVRVALETLAAGADDVKAIEVVVLHSRKKSAPKTPGILHQQMIGIFRVSTRLSAGLAEHEIHFTGFRRPRAERGATMPESGAQRRIGIDVEL